MVTNRSDEPYVVTERFMYSSALNKYVLFCLTCKPFRRKKAQTPSARNSWNMNKIEIL